MLFTSGSMAWDMSPVLPPPKYATDTDSAINWFGMLKKSPLRTWPFLSEIVYHNKLAPGQYISIEKHRKQLNKHFIFIKNPIVCLYGSHDSWLDSHNSRSTNFLPHDIKICLSQAVLRSWELGTDNWIFIFIGEMIYTLKT